jgi:pimeloyl-ACP methyl ester carboxylesterase
MPVERSRNLRTRKCIPSYYLWYIFCRILFIPRINTFLSSLSHLHKPVIRTVISYEKVLDFFNTLGLVGKNLDREVFMEIVDGFMDLDFKIYYKLMDSLGEHDASDLLPRIDVPVLIVSSEKDVMTPPSVIERMVEEIPRAEHFSIPAGSHYSAIEYPEILNLRLDKFFREHFPRR